MVSLFNLFISVCYIYGRGVSSEEPGEVENPSDIASVSKFITDFHVSKSQ
jgi:hypothetical protein